MQSIFDANFSVKWTEQDPPLPPAVLESPVVYMEYESCIHKNSLLVLVILFNSVVDRDCFVYLQFVGNWKDKTTDVCRSVMTDSQVFGVVMLSFFFLFLPCVVWQLRVLLGFAVTVFISFSGFCLAFFIVDPGCGVLCLCVDNTHKCQTKTTTEKLCFAS